ncbi:MAG: exodeoxyribonuclease VII small subunit [Clostridia bacterium]|nr:exodeoxyribonuclease VII small subunit [Clostridia bacterium]
MKQTFETAIKKLEETVNALEEGNLTLNDSLKLYEQGTKLAAFCGECLDKAEQKIKELSEIKEEVNE